MSQKAIWDGAPTEILQEEPVECERCGSDRALLKVRYRSYDTDIYEDYFCRECLSLSKINQE